MEFPLTKYSDGYLGHLRDEFEARRVQNQILKMLHRDPKKSYPFVDEGATAEDCEVPLPSQYDWKE